MDHAIWRAPVIIIGKVTYVAETWDAAYNRCQEHMRDNPECGGVNFDDLIQYPCPLEVMNSMVESVMAGQGGAVLARATAGVLWQTLRLQTEPEEVTH